MINKEILQDNEDSIESKEILEYITKYTKEIKAASYPLKFNASDFESGMMAMWSYMNKKAKENEGKN